ncbi:MAG: hypothetical protein RIS70_1306 [Planctomycetota bacterium]
MSSLPVDLDAKQAIASVKPAWTLLLNASRESSDTLFLQHMQTKAPASRVETTTSPPPAPKTESGVHATTKPKESTKPEETRSDDDVESADDSSAVSEDAASEGEEGAAIAQEEANLALQTEGKEKGDEKSGRTRPGSGRGKHAAHRAGKNAGNGSEHVAASEHADSKQAELATAAKGEGIAEAQAGEATAIADATVSARDEVNVVAVQDPNTTPTANLVVTPVDAEGGKSKPRKAKTAEVHEDGEPVKSVGRQSGAKSNGRANGVQANGGADAANHATAPGELHGGDEGTVQRAGAPTRSRQKKSGNDIESRIKEAGLNVPPVESTAKDASASALTGGGLTSEPPKEIASGAPAPGVGPRSIDGPAPASPLVRNASSALRRGEDPGNVSSLNPRDQVRFLNRVSKAIQAAQEREGEIRLRLSPPELGSLRLEVRMQGNLLTARLEAENPTSRNLLMENLPELRERLAEQGIQIQQFDVDLMDHRQSGQEQNAFNTRQDDRQSGGSSMPDYRDPRRSPQRGNEEAAAPTAPRSQGNSRINIIV